MAPDFSPESDSYSLRDKYCYEPVSEVEKPDSLEDLEGGAYITPCDDCKKVRDYNYAACDECPNKRYSPRKKSETCPTCGKPRDDEENCCYITSACLDDLGIPRTSLEMKAMKTLAKDFILKSFGGKRDYITYGRIAPKIVEAIRSKPDAHKTWNNVYESIKEVTSSVTSGNYQKGYDQYKSLVFGLEAQFAK